MHNRCDTYIPPNGGGGVSDSIKVGDTTITFGHGGRHLGMGLSVSEVNSTIANDVVSRSLPMGKAVQYFDVTLGSRTIHYGVVRLTDKLINIGTYYVP